MLEWGWPIFPNLGKPKEPAAKAVNSWKEWLPISTARSGTWKRARHFIIYTEVFIACSSKRQHGQAGFSLCLLRPSNAKKWEVFLPSGPGQYTTNLACCECWTKQTWELLLTCLAAWQVSLLNTISPLKFPLSDWRLHFHLLKCDLFFSSSLFSILVWCNLIFRPIFFKPKLKLVRNAIRPLYMRFRATVRVLIIKVALNLMPTSSLTVQEEVLMSDFLDQRKIVLWKLFLALTNNYLKGAFYQPIGPNRLNRWKKLFSYDVKPVNYHERKFARLPAVSGFSLHIISHSCLSILTWPSFVSL